MKDKKIKFIILILIIIITIAVFYYFKNDNSIYIGKIEERRNIMLLIDILSNINKSRDDVRLIMVGKGEKKYFNGVLKYINKKQLDNFINVL